MSADYGIGQWALLAAGAALFGMSKTGLPGIGILAVAVFANVLGARPAAGVVLPLLICADLFGVLLYRRHVQWGQLWGLLPWTVAGVVAGWLVLGRVDDAAATRLVGMLLLAMLGLHFWLRRDGGRHEPPAWLAPGSGMAAGFTTLVANAAGPVMTVYLLARRLPKLEFLGTGAVFFAVVNWFKLPFMAQLGLVNAGSLGLNLRLLPALLAGVVLGRLAAARMEQRRFETVALALTLVATVKLLFF